MAKQNRILGFIFIFCVIIIGFFLLRSGQFYMFSDSTAKPASSKDIHPSKPGLSQESMGDPVPAQDKAPTPPVNPEEKKNFSEMVKMMANCFHLGTSIPETMSPTSESLLSYLQNEWGTYEAADQWINWHFLTKEGIERRLRLEVTENDDGVRGRELHFYAVDKEGLPIPITLENVSTHNPSDEVINDVLKEVEVFFKEKAAVAIYSQGAHVDYVEKNGNLDSIEIHEGDMMFRCSNFKNVSVNCLCYQ